MINKMLFGVVFAAVGALAYGWYYNNQRIVVAQQEKLQSFINAGPRFTAQDGKRLCERIRALEQLSYGLNDAGKFPLPCDYSTPPVPINLQVTP